jgi:hypothetical protein
MYYPKSQIVTNLYTNGGELSYVDSPQIEYKGYYWKTSKGKFFSGKTPQDLLIQELVLLESTAVATPNQNPILNSPNWTPNDFPAIEYPKYGYKEVITPIYFLNIPTNQDYQKGTFTRYFCKKVNELIYIEISKDTFNKLINQDPSIGWQLYFPFQINWKLTGSKEDVFKVNRNIVEIAVNKNKLYQFDGYLKKDYLKFWK